MDTLPPELVLYLIPFFPLSSLIAARGVNTRWRSFAQIASLHPARKVLLDLYLAAIAHPNFPSLMEELQPHVQEFDREAYITDLTSRGCVLPHVFELWVLEWPSKAVHFWAWPGLAREVSVHHNYHYGGGNMLSEAMPTVETIPVPKEEAERVGKTCRGLALWEIDAMCNVRWVVQLWLVVDENERINDRRAGRILWTLDGPDGTGGPKRIFYDTPLQVENLIGFLDLLDFGRDALDYELDGYYLGGIQESSLE